MELKSHKYRHLNNHLLVFYFTVVIYTNVDFRFQRRKNIGKWYDRLCSQFGGGGSSSQPIIILNPNFDTNGNASGNTYIVGIYNSNLASRTIYNWNFNTDTPTKSIIAIFYGHDPNTFNLPAQYNYGCYIQNYNGSGTNYISQNINFPQAGTYTLSFYAGGRNTNYSTAQSLSAYIDTTQVITNTTFTANGTAILLTSSSFTVTAGTHTIKIQTVCSSTNVDTSIFLSGFTITKQ